MPETNTEKPPLTVGRHGITLKGLYLQPWLKRVSMALHSKVFHPLLKDDERWEVRRAVAGMNPDYHEQMVHDEHPKVRIEIALQSPHLHHLLENDEDEAIREVIRKYREKEKISRTSSIDDELNAIAANANKLQRPRDV